MINDILNKVVHLCKIRNDGKEYLTLYYFSSSDSHERLLHSNTEIKCFESESAARAYCAQNGLSLKEKIIYLDFDDEITRDINARSTVIKWNILDGMAKALDVEYASGSEYDGLYDYIFSRAASENVSIFLSIEQTAQLKNVFAQRSSILRFF